MGLSFNFLSTSASSSHVIFLKSVPFGRCTDQPAAFSRPRTNPRSPSALAPSSNSLPVNVSVSILVCWLSAGNREDALLLISVVAGRVPPATPPLYPAPIIFRSVSYPVAGFNFLPGRQWAGTAQWAATFRLAYANQRSAFRALLLWDPLVDPFVVYRVALFEHADLWGWFCSSGTEARRTTAPMVDANARRCC